MNLEEKLLNARVCFLGSATYTNPLNETARKKFANLSRVGTVFVIGFGSKLFETFDEHAHFYLVRYPRRLFIRYPMRVLTGVLLSLWCIFRHRVSIIVAQSPFDGFSARCARGVARLLGRRVVLVVENHSDFEVAPGRQTVTPLPAVYSRSLNWAARVGVDGADLFRAVSSNTREQLAELSSKPIFEFPTWTDIEAFFEAGPPKPSDGWRDLIFAGILIPRKGVLHLIEALGTLRDSIPDARVVLAGAETDADYVSVLHARIRELDLEERVVFTGALSQRELAAWMGRSFAFVLPSYSEGLPRVLLEAMAVGLPSVATDVSGIPDVLVDGQRGFLIPAGDEGLLAEKLAWLLQHPQEAAAMGEDAREFVRDVFSSERYTRGYAEVLSAGLALAD